MRRVWTGCTVMLVVLVGLAPIATGEDGNLGKDLEKLNVRLKTPHYALAGTVSDARLAECGRCLEFIHREYARGFEGLLARGRQKADGGKGMSGSPQQGHPEEADKPAERRAVGVGDRAEDDDDRFEVVVFANNEEYQSFGARYLSGETEHTGGMFLPNLGLLLILDTQDASELYNTLFHEAFHQFADRYMPHIPMWVNEGLATFYGTAQVGRHGLRFDQPDQTYLLMVRQAASRNLLIPLDDVIMADRATFYDSRPLAPGMTITRKSLYYGQSYTLVAYMLDSKEGRAHLRGYLRDLASAESAKQALAMTRKHFPPRLLDKMVPGWLAMVSQD